MRHSKGRLQVPHRNGFGGKYTFQQNCSLLSHQCIGNHTSCMPNAAYGVESARHIFSYHPARLNLVSDVALLKVHCRLALLQTRPVCSTAGDHLATA